jgi:hypothetical protein
VISPPPYTTTKPTSTAQAVVTEATEGQPEQPTSTAAAVPATSSIAPFKGAAVAVDGTKGVVVGGVMVLIAMLY